MNMELDVLRAVHRRLDRTRPVDESVLAPETPLVVGIGYAALTRDGDPVFEAPSGDLECEFTVRHAEAMAALEPWRAWRIHLVAQLDERHYERDADGRWTLYSRGYGLS